MKLAPQRHASLLAESRLGSTEEIKNGVLSFGKEAEVVEPGALREEMANELGALTERYASHGLSSSGTKRSECRQ